jgi:dTDP-4-amino-4,6-dideoxygalactose transaminase
MVKNDPQLTQDNGKWFYELYHLGFNYRMTDMQAALGISQLKRIEEFKKKRRHIVSLYKKFFANDGRVSFLEESSSSDACFHLWPALVNFNELKIDKKEFFDQLWEAGLHLQVHYAPVHLFRHYRDLGFSEGDFPKAEKYYERTISLPLYQDLSDDDIECVSKTFLRILNNV